MGLIALPGLRRTFILATKIFALSRRFRQMSRAAVLALPAQPDKINQTNPALSLFSPRTRQTPLEKYAQFFVPCRLRQVHHQNDCFLEPK